MAKRIIKVRKTEEREELFCIIRRKWLMITPEELVRQQFIIHLIELGFAEGLISTEQGFSLEWGKQLRADIIVYGIDAKPLILIECKAPTIELSQEVFTQASKYNTIFKAPYIVITNGKKSMLFSSNDFINYSHLNMSQLQNIAITNNNTTTKP